MEDNISKEFISKALKAFEKYKNDKADLSRRIRENDYWYKARYGKIINPASNETQPSTAFILSAIENKFSDAVDSFPTPNILARTPADEQISKLLTKIVPVQLDISDFKSAYKQNWRRKLKHGTGVYGIFYADNKIVIKSISILNVYCDMHVNNVQDSQFLFITNAIDNRALKKAYPEFSALFTGNAKIETFDGTHEAEDKTEVIDCYYKKDGILHCMKLCGGEVISATESEGYESGLYRHGLYPVVFDVLYPEEDCPFGFGIVDIAKNPQMYIDKLDAAIIKNSILSSKIRFLIKDNGAVNEDEILNCDNDIIHVTGGIDNDSIRELQIGNVSSSVMEHRIKKIDELKEVIGNRDFQQGGTSGGVTAASAITVLQEAGNKISRSMIDDSYDVYKKIVMMMIELMREFFTSARIYRITGETSSVDYITFSANELYRPDAISNAYEPIEFDIDVVPQKKNPFNRESNNSTILELWKAGIFSSENAENALIAVSAMDFDGKEKILEKIQELAVINEQRQKIESGELVPINDETISELVQ